MNLVLFSDFGINLKNIFYWLEVNGFIDVYFINLWYCKIFYENFFSVIGVFIEEIS